MPAQPTIHVPDASYFRQPAGRRLFHLTLEVVTPMFGGSARPGEIDPAFLINGKGVRGQLRFWWRACRAAKFGTASELFENEAKIWGQAARKQKPDQEQASKVKDRTYASALDVEVEILSRGKRYDPDDFRGASHALFPFREETKPNGETKEKQFGREGVRFSLTITAAPGIAETRYAELVGDAEAALWAWITFGGVGARTRRGCGTLYCVNDDASSCWTSKKLPPADRFIPDGLVADWLETSSVRYVTAGQPIWGVPSLINACMVLGNDGTPLETWKNAIEKLGTFRTALRRATGNRFLHADLGLPIVLGQRTNTRTIWGAKKQARRLASAVLVKSFPLDTDYAVSLVVVLNAPHVWDPNTPGVEITNRNKPLSADELMNRGQIPPDKKQPLMANTEKSSRFAFLRYVEEHWDQSEMLVLKGGAEA